MEGLQFQTTLSSFHGKVKISLGARPIHFSRKVTLGRCVLVSFLVQQCGPAEAALAAPLTFNVGS